MSEKIFALLLQLYPQQFRQRFGEEALQLWRDRLRDEKGILQQFRLWIDLIWDLTSSLPRAYHSRSETLARAGSSANALPGLHTLETGSISPGIFILATVAALFAVGGVLALSTIGGKFRMRHIATTRDPSYALQTSAQDPAQNPPDRIPAGKPDANASASDSAMYGVLQAPERKWVIETAITNLKKYYLAPDVADQMATALQSHEQSGDDDVPNRQVFARLLTQQMQEVSHDKHLRLEYSVTPTPANADGPSPQQLAQMREEMKRENCGFSKVEMLPNSVGLIQLDAFPDREACASIAQSAMKSMNGAHALIFDLRENRGGDPHMVSLVATYLFPQPTHLNDIYNPRAGTQDEFWTGKAVPGNNLADKPVFILTSRLTFSGGEEFCYDLKMLKRATLIGENTAGGAHLGSWHRLDAHYGMGIPFAKPVNPISHTDWEGTGVQPDIEVRAADALAVAEKLANGNLQKHNF